MYIHIIFTFNCFKSYKIQILVQHIQLLRQLGRGSRRDLFLFAISKPARLVCNLPSEDNLLLLFFFYQELFHILTTDVVTLVIRYIEKKRIFRGNGKLV